MKNLLLLVVFTVLAISDICALYESNQLIEWTTPIDRKAYLISLNTDEDYTIVLLADNVVINTKRFSTYSSDNKIEVSEDLYEVLTKAGRKETYEDALCDALLTADVDSEEKLSFYQKFYMDGLKFKEGDGVDDFTTHELSPNTFELKQDEDKLDQGEEINLYIYDVLGRVSYDGTATINSSGSIILTHNLNQGLYYIVAERGREIFKSKIFIK